MSTHEIIEIGKVLLPYLRKDITPAELGTVSHDVVVKLNQLRSEEQKKTALAESSQ